MPSIISHDAITLGRICSRNDLPPLGGYGTLIRPLAFALYRHPHTKDARR